MPHHLPSKVPNNPAQEQNITHVNVSSGLLCSSAYLETTACQHLHLTPADSLTDLASEHFIGVLAAGVGGNVPTVTTLSSTSLRTCLGLTSNFALTRARWRYADIKTLAVRRHLHVTSYLGLNLRGITEDGSTACAASSCNRTIAGAAQKTKGNHQPHLEKAGPK